MLTKAATHKTTARKGTTAERQRYSMRSEYSEETKKCQAEIKRLRAVVNALNEEIEQSKNKLQCTSVAVYPFKSDGKTKGYARIELNGQLVLTGLRIVNGVNGYFVSYPIDPRNKEEDYHSIYYPLGKELREHIEQAILAKYAEIAGEAIQAEGV